MRDSMTRLTLGIESISNDLHEIKGEVKTQVTSLREEITKQVSDVRADVFDHQAKHERRIRAIEWRIDGVNARIDTLAAGGCPVIDRDPPPPDDE